MTAPTLQARALTTVRSAILDGELAPGQKLIERELTELTGASRSVLREALVNLEANGLIERESYRGFRVTQLSLETINEIFELRATLETLAFELFAVRATDAELTQLRDRWSHLASCARGNDPSAMRAAKEQWYDVVFVGCGNRELRRALEHVVVRISYLRTQWAADASRRAASVAELGELTDALAARDQRAARAASLTHLDAARTAAIARLQSQPA